MKISYIAALARDNQEGFFVDFGYMPQETMFDQALALQQKQNWDASLETYQKLLDQSIKEMSNTQASVIYHNMSTLAFEKGDLIKAYIWSKKSLSLNPKNQMAQNSFNQYSKKVEIPVIAHQITNYDHFKSFISKISIDLWLTLSLCLVLALFWLILKNFLNSKKNQLAGLFTTQKKWPIMATAFLTLSVLSVCYIRYQDEFTTRALVLTEKAQVQTAPGENKPVIFEVQSGQELEVLNEDQDYFQVRYPGAFSGWIKKAQLEILSLSFEH